METKYITDTDFLPSEVTSQRIWSNDLDEDLYQITYGILRDDATLETVYDLIVRISKQQTIDTIKRFKLQSWKKSLESILKTLNKLNSKDHEVIVQIPFLGEGASIGEVISKFRLAVFTIDEILTNGDEKMSIEANPTYLFPIKTIKELFDSYVDEYMEELLENGYSVYNQTTEGEDKVFDESSYWYVILLDEMHRRGIQSVGKAEITPSKYYNEPERYKFAFIERESLLDTNKLVSSIHIDESFDPNSETNKLRTAVMFYMLDSFSPITDENKHQAIALMNYSIGKVYNIKAPKKETNNNNVRKYVSNLRNGQYLKSEKIDFLENLRDRLLEYGFDVPEVINENIPSNNEKKADM